jgi:ComF family protein
MRGPARTLVHHLKYRGGLAVLSDIGQLMREMPDLEEFLGGKVLVPVPLHPRKLRERGYNQSEEIANELARLFPCTHAMPLLKRVRDTTTQTRLDRTARLANLKNAFALTETRTLYAALRCVLVDDVFTTGSTLNACARALCGAGCQRVDVLTFGHG